MSKRSLDFPALLKITEILFKLDFETYMWNFIFNIYHIPNELSSWKDIAHWKEKNRVGLTYLKLLFQQVFQPQQNVHRTPHFLSQADTG